MRASLIRISARRRATSCWSRSFSARSRIRAFKTIASWTTRLEESGPRTLVQLRTPVNKFPEFVGYAVKRLQALCPTLGKKKLAQILARAGLHLSATTIGRLRQEKPSSAPPSRQEPRASGRIVTAKRPNHVWHIDLTTVPTQSGFWCSWFPFAVPQCWPFAWWLVVVLDHYSRRSMGCAITRQAPTAAAIRSFLGRVIRSVGTAPKYLISDKGSQFWPTPSYQHWCRRRHIRPRFGALGAHGSIAVLERAWQTINALRPSLVPIRRQKMCRDMSWLLDWYNRRRPCRCRPALCPTVAIAVCSRCGRGRLAAKTHLPASGSWIGITTRTSCTLRPEPTSGRSL